MDRISVRRLTLVNFICKLHLILRRKLFKREEKYVVATGSATGYYFSSRKKGHLIEIVMITILTYIVEIELIHLQVGFCFILFQCSILYSLVYSYNIMWTLPSGGCKHKHQLRNVDIYNCNLSLKLLLHMLLNFCSFCKIFSNFYQSLDWSLAYL